MKLNKLEYWFNNLSECLTINLSDWDNDYDILTYGNDNSSATPVDIANAFQHWGFDKIESLLIHNNEKSAIEQYEQFEREVIKNFKDHNEVKNYCVYLHNRIYDLQSLTNLFSKEISLAYNTDLADFNEVVRDTFNISIQYNHIQDFESLATGIALIKNEYPTENTVTTYEEVVASLRSGIDDRWATMIWGYAYQKRFLFEEDNLNMWMRSQNVAKMIEDVDYLRDAGFFPHVLLPEKLSIAYACCVLTAVDQTVEFLKNQLAIHDFQEPVVSIVEKPKKEKKDQISLKQQLILLDELGFMYADGIKNIDVMTTKAKLIAQLLNRSKKDVYDLLRGWTSRNNPQKGKKSLVTDKDEEAVKDLLDECGLI